MRDSGEGGRSKGDWPKIFQKTKHWARMMGPTHYTMILIEIFRPRRSVRNLQKWEPSPLV